MQGGQRHAMLLAEAPQRGQAEALPVVAIADPVITDVQPII